MHKHHVIIRDDDLNATSDWQAWRETMSPFLDNGLSVCASVIPCVNTRKLNAKGLPESYLNAVNQGYVAISENDELCKAIKNDPLIHPLQHGYTHGEANNLHEFSEGSVKRVQADLGKGENLLREAGIHSRGFVAPYDQFSRAAFTAITRRYQVFSASYLSVSRVNLSNLPRYLVQKKLLNNTVFNFSGCQVFGHSGCQLDPALYHHSSIEHLLRQIYQQSVTVIVLHHWQYKIKQHKNILIELAHTLRKQPAVAVTNFNRM